MSGFWLISYVCLWIVVVILCLLVTGLLQQLGSIQHHIQNWKSDQADDSSEVPEGAVLSAPPLISEDGPDIGSSIPELTLEVYNDKSTLTPTSWYNEYGTLVMLMTPMCESCQHLVDPLNQLRDHHVFKGRVIVILRADEGACQAFLSVFPLHVPVVCDRDHTISMGFGIHHIPFGLLYDAQGKLARKGNILTYEALLALLGDPSVSLEAFARIYPPLSTLEV